MVNSRGQRDQDAPNPQVTPFLNTHRGAATRRRAPIGASPAGSLPTFPAVRTASSRAGGNSYPDRNVTPYLNTHRGAATRRRAPIGASPAGSLPTFPAVRTASSRAG